MASRRIAGTVYMLLDGTAPSAAPQSAPSNDPSNDPSVAPPGNPSGQPIGRRAELEDHVETLKDEVQHLRAEMLRREETHAEEITCSLRR